MINIFGIKGTAQKFSGWRENELKTFLGTRGFINGEQGIKSKKIKGSREHVPPLGGAPGRNERDLSSCWTAVVARSSVYKDKYYKDKYWLINLFIKIFQTAGFKGENQTVRVKLSAFENLKTRLPF